MPTDSPHLYRREGRRRGLSNEVIDTVEMASARLLAHGVAVVLTLGHLAWRSGAPYPYLRKVVERSIDPYHAFAIKRRAGKNPRLISSPSPLLMDVQRWILARILDHVTPHPASYAYRRGVSIRMCAEQHLGARWLIKMDLHNFFHTIDERQVFKVFADLGYAPLLALELARLCTRRASDGFPHPTRFQVGHHRHSVIPTYSADAIGFVPQGAPTSGAIANLAVRPLDEALAALASAHRLVYTRYADDIVFSSAGAFDRRAAASLMHKARHEIAACGFAAHDKKTRLTPPGARRIVLGLLVDGDKVRLPREMRSRIATHVHAAEKFGLREHQLSRGFTSVLGLARHVDGLLAFASDVDPAWTDDLRTRWRRTLLRDASALGAFEISDVYRQRDDGTTAAYTVAATPWDAL
jgi:RNA-directed DNA polymerase